jgi:hypothetical protein
MKRSVPLFVLFGLLALLIPALTVFGEAPKGNASGSHACKSCKSCCQGCCAKCGPAIAASGNNDLVKELSAILKETKSPETFVVTVMALSRLGTEAKPAIPGIIRNAERLALLKDIGASGDDSGPSKLTQEIVADIQMILDGTTNPKTPTPTTYGYPTVNAYPTYPAPPTPTGYYPPGATFNAPVPQAPCTAPPQPAACPPAAVSETPKNKHKPCRPSIAPGGSGSGNAP